MKENKVIPFRSPKQRKRTKGYKLIELQIYILRNDEMYTCNWFARDPNMSEEEIYIIMNKIFEQLVESVPEINIKVKDSYEVNCIIFYYENVEDTTDFKFIYQPANITKEKLTEYIYTTIQIYNYKNV